MTIGDRMDRIVELMPPPRQPLHCGSSDDWTALTDRMGFYLPHGYEQFVKMYGSGSIATSESPHGVLALLNPFDPYRYSNLIEQIPPILSTLAELKAEFPETCPFPLLWEPGGFLPWGVSDQGGKYGWLTEGAQGCWRIAVVPTDDEPYSESIDFLAFILKIVKEIPDSQGRPRMSSDGPFHWVANKRTNT